MIIDCIAVAGGTGFLTAMTASMQQGNQIFDVNDCINATGKTDF